MLQIPTVRTDYHRLHSSSIPPYAVVMELRATTLLAAEDGDIAHWVTPSSSSGRSDGSQASMGAVMRSKGLKG